LSGAGAACGRGRAHLDRHAVRPCCRAVPRRRRCLLERACRSGLRNGVRARGWRRGRRAHLSTRSIDD